MHQAGQTLSIVWNEKDQIVERYELRRPAQGYSKVFQYIYVKSPISTPWIQTENIVTEIIPILVIIADWSFFILMCFRDDPVESSIRGCVFDILRSKEEMFS